MSSAEVTGRLLNWTVLAHARRLGRPQGIPNRLQRCQHRFDIEVDADGRIAQVLDLAAERFDTAAQRP
jgi:hypothetical protein